MAQDTDEVELKNSQSVGLLVDKLRDIPTLSVVVLKVMELVNNPKTSAAQIADVLRRDQILTAKILRLVNSSFYALATPVTDVPRALGFLGYNTISVLVLGTSVFSTFEVSETPYFNVMGFWKHSLASAIAAEMLAKRIKLARPEDVFTCGLLHDLGKIALFQVSKEDFKAVIEKTTMENKTFLEAETELGLPGHTILGERLAERWQLPVVIRKTIRYHHRDIEPMTSVYASMKPTIMTATIGNLIAKRFSLGESGDNAKPEYPANYLRILNITPDILKEIEDKMPDEMDRAQAFLNAGM
jgi:putative nucleotidyltransferase with HDIG domain